MTELDTLYSIYARSASACAEPVLPYADWLADVEREQLLIMTALFQGEAGIQALIDYARGRLEARK